MSIPSDKIIPVQLHSCNIKSLPMFHDLSSFADDVKKSTYLLDTIIWVIFLILTTKNKINSVIIGCLILMGRRLCGYTLEKPILQRNYLISNP